MAERLLAAGHQVTVFNRSRAKAEPLEAIGAQIAQDVGSACAADVVFTMLSNDQVVENVVFARGGVIDSLPEGAIHVSASTISVALSSRLAAAHAGRDQRYVAAPVMGRPTAAAAGKLFVVAAGDQTALDEVAPLLAAVGRRTVEFGPDPSSANLVKLSVNFLVASVIETLGEALALVGKAGLDREHYLDFLTSTLFEAPVYKTFGPLIIQESPEPAGFAAVLAFKDIRLAIAAGEELAVPLPVASLLHDRFVELLAAGGANLDWSNIGRRGQHDGAPKTVPQNHSAAAA